MSKERILEIVIERIIDQSVNDGAVDKVRIFAEDKRFSVTPSEMADALKSLSYTGDVSVIGQKDHGDQFTSFDVQLKAPMMARVHKVQIPVPLTEPENLSPVNFSALIKFAEHINNELEMTQNYEISLAATPEYRTAFDYFKQRGCFNVVDQNLISVYRPIFFDFYGRLKAIRNERERKNGYEKSVLKSESFYFNQGVLCRNGCDTVEVFPENSMEHLLLIIAFEQPKGERIDGYYFKGRSSPTTDFNWRSLYDATRRINKKVKARFDVDDFFKINFNGKFVERNF